MKKGPRTKKKLGIGVAFRGKAVYVVARYQPRK